MMAKVAQLVNRSFWKVAGLVDAGESEVGEIVDLREMPKMTNGN